MVTGSPNCGRSADDHCIELPAPRYERRVSLTQALRQRRSTREYSEQDLSTQLLSDLLWSGFGINLFRGALDVQQLRTDLDAAA